MSHSTGTAPREVTDPIRRGYRSVGCWLTDQPRHVVGLLRRLLSVPIRLPGPACRRLLSSIPLSHRSIAALLHVNDRVVRRWVQPQSDGPGHSSTVILLWVLARHPELISEIMASMELTPDGESWPVVEEPSRPEHD